LNLTLFKDNGLGVAPTALHVVKLIKLRPHYCSFETVNKLPEKLEKGYLAKFTRSPAGSEEWRLVQILPAVSTTSPFIYSATLKRQRWDLNAF
jgi:hypothetical protein